MSTLLRDDLAPSADGVGPLGAFLSGVRGALVYWPVLLALYLLTLLAVLPLAIFPSIGLADLARRPVIADLAAGLQTWQILDLVVLVSNARPGLSVSAVQTQLTALLAIPLGLPLLGALVSAFAWGGALLVYVEATGRVRAGPPFGQAQIDRLVRPYSTAPVDPLEQPQRSDPPFDSAQTFQSEQSYRSEQIDRSDLSSSGALPFRAERFLWGSWHWFGTFLLLALIQALLFVIVLLPLMGLGLSVSAGLGGIAGGLGWLVLALLAGLAALWLAVFELARVQAVVTGTRNPLRALGRAFRLIVRRPLALLIFYALSLAALAAVHALYRGLLLPRLPINSLLAVFVQQSFIIVRLLARALRIAGLAVLAVGVGRADMRIGR